MRRIYVAGPLGAVAGRQQRVRDAIAMGDELLRAGFWPFVPHLFCQWDEIFEHHYEEWMQLDFVWLAQCEAVLRMPGESPGADREVAWAKANGRPVFTDIDALRRWVFEPQRAEKNGRLEVGEEAEYEVSDKFWRRVKLRAELTRHGKRAFVAEWRGGNVQIFESELRRPAPPLVVPPDVPKASR